MGDIMGDSRHTDGDSAGEVKYRESETSLLSAFITRDTETLTPSLVVHGASSSGKSHTLNKFLDTISIKNSVIRCDECLTHRVLLQRCIKAIITDSGLQSDYKNTIDDDVAGANAMSCENFEKFIINLEKFIENTKYSAPHVLVLDRIDQCMENPSELYPAFARLHESALTKNFCVVFVISTLDPKSIITSTLPHVFFRCYTQGEVIEVLQTEQICSFPGSYFSEDELIYEHEKDIENEFWRNYVKVVVDSLFSYTGADLVSLKNVLFKLWDKFTEPIISGKFKPNQFLKVYKESQNLFSGEYAITDTMVDSDASSNITQKQGGGSDSYDLPLISKYILIASYLASYNHPKHDTRIFTRQKESKRRKTNSRSKKNKISSRMLSPSSFELERMLAILSAIYFNESGVDAYSLDEDSEEVNRSITSNIDINSQIGTLLSLKLISKSLPTDPLNAKTRWKSNLNWSVIQTIAKDIDFPIQNYIEE